MTAADPPIEPFRSFTFHVKEDDRSQKLARRLSPGPALGRRMDRAPRSAMASLDEESVARLYLRALLESDELDLPTHDPDDPSAPGFRRLGVSRVSETGHRVVKFRQTYRGVPVYGTLITVELSAVNYLRAITWNRADPGELDPLARLSPVEAWGQVAEVAGRGVQAPVRAPELFVRYREASGNWHLVYRFGGVSEAPSDDLFGGMRFDYLVDAHSGSPVDREPSAPACVEQAVGTDGEPVPIQCFEAPSGTKILADLENRVATYDFDFQSLDTQADRLFDRFASRRAVETWDPVAVTAHAHATWVARYLSEVHGRLGVDHRNTPYRQVIHCVRHPGDDEMHNAFWTGTGAVYGQRREGGRLVSYAEDLDTVAHELFHGVIASQSDLRIVGESGALNESCADVFAVLALHRDDPDSRRWTWEVGVASGAGIEGGETGLRDLSDPALFGQPTHMDDYRNLPVDAAHDWGGVHVNCAIHSLAWHLLLISEDAGGRLLFPPILLARLFYLVVTELLSPTSIFADSRRAAEHVALSLLPDDGLRGERRAAIASAFDRVGIDAGG